MCDENVMAKGVVPSFQLLRFFSALLVFLGAHLVCGCLNITTLFQFKNCFKYIFQF